MAVKTYINRKNITKLVHDSVVGTITINLADGTTLEMKSITNSEAEEIINFIGAPKEDKFFLRIDL